MHATVPLVKSLREFVRDALLERIARNELGPWGKQASLSLAAA